MCSYDIFCNSWTFVWTPASHPVQSVSQSVSQSADCTPLSDSFVCVVNTESNTKLHQPWRSLVFYSVCVCAQFVWGGPKVPPEAICGSGYFLCALLTVDATVLLLAVFESCLEVFVCCVHTEQKIIATNCWPCCHSSQSCASPPLPPSSLTTLLSFLSF